MSNNDDFGRHFLEANANAKYMGVELADLVRRLMRASINQDRSQQYEASQALKHLLELAAHAKGIKLYQIVEQAVDCLSVKVDFNNPDYDRVNFAEDATGYLLEMACNDGFAKGRASKRWDSFKRGMDNFEEMQKYRIERMRKKQER